MTNKNCSKCGVSNLDVEFHNTSTYCKYCKSIIEAKRRYNKSLETAEDKYKFQRSFLYRSVHFKDRSLDFCAQVMGFHIQELDLALDAIGYYNNDYRWCSNCAFLKPISDFRKANNRKKGHQDWCNDCKKEYEEQNIDYIRDYRTIYHYENRERRLAIVKDHYNKYRDHYLKMNRDYYFTHKDDRNEYAKEYYENNKDWLLALQRNYYQENKDSIRARGKSYYENNSDKFKLNASLRRARILKAQPKWADMKKIRDIYEEAAFLERFDGVKRHVDHIIPLVSDKVCGLHVESNLQILTAKENLSKHNKFELIIE